MERLIYFAPVLGICALLFAFYLTKKVGKQDAGTDRMKEIAAFIHEGARAFLTAEYKILVVFVAVLFVLIGIGIGNWVTAVCFLAGALFSTAAGYIGMNVATKANVRTAAAAKDSGMNKALSIAFSGGAVMGMCVVGFGLFGAGVVYILTKNPDVLSGFSLGASSIALFARVGGGIYTKAADVGADLVGKVEAGIPEDDPRNPAVIADNVGDNVGDVAGMGADLFESYVGSLVSAITLGVVYAKESGAIFPLVIAALGVLASVIGCFFVKGDENSSPHKALKYGSYSAAIVVMIGSLILSKMFFNGFKEAIAIIFGLVVGLLIGVITEIYTSGDYRFVKKIAQQSETGPATTVISGIAVGMQSTAVPIILIAIGIIGAYSFSGLYGIALAAVGMLSTTGITVAVDAYGPIADNAGGIAEMSGLPSEVRNITDKLDAVGNTTAAMGKGFAIGSAALTALALFVSYAQAVGLFEEGINLLDYKVIVGMFVGGMLPFLFSAFTMDSVSKAAYKMIEEVRRQFKTIPGILEGKGKPDYKSCVAISTQAALKEMLLPGVMAVLAPVFIGVVLGPDALGGLLGGALVTGVMLAIFMSNSGGAWDNAKKYIEDGHHGGKGSEAHRAAVVGDTVGDPFKDTSGPSINILIKLMTIVSLVFAPLFLKIGGLF
ncbi:sodium-translocating pyrophosphatase [Anaerobutyricum hallii]|jgi:K(+)-stimulated pyrophosphate-energized sodium pump|uniref:Putative K(+)-stimulated pyrophosphate-energized sodium pump n=1 Tax=Anaerobutyricum hallii TaxID=39488 RepID=A0A374NI84_9FIRM|nr:sodium-translocating pyrophosphatase [Anaerobutyricum hallii]RGI84790.1 sodium-translocating pyrophosphatase [Anaerobutyricum hallii]